MGYHNAVDQYKGVVEFANSAINDRERLRYALSMTLEAIGLNEKEREQVINDVRNANFESINSTLTKEITMENQHRKIKGYRELSQAEIDLMNEIKIKGAEIGELIDSLEEAESLDKRWIAIGKTNLQQGLMALTRAVAQPDFF